MDFRRWIFTAGSLLLVGCRGLNDGDLTEPPDGSHCREEAPAWCDATCVDTSSDVAHCGGCGEACEATLHVESLACQQGACAITKAVLQTNWRAYGLQQSRGALPTGPLTILVHIASVWVPFTSESKEAIADYDEIRKEIKLALQESGRRLGVFLRRRERAKTEFRRRNIFELYIEEVVEACARLKGGRLPKERLKSQLMKIAVKRTGGARTA